MIKILFRSTLFLLLTILTQIGGLIYLIAIVTIRRKKKKHTLLKRICLFFGLYLLSTFFIVPYTAPFFGRQKINNNHRIDNHNFLITLCNRNYVTSKAHKTLTDISLRFHKISPTVKLVYLDANFPFFDGFPLLPHLSHNDGNKIDISFIYSNENGELTNQKPSYSGYGVFEEPISGEMNQNEICKQNGAWQYNYPKYLTMGTNNQLQLDSENTRKLIEVITENPNVQNIFIEPHLKKRSNLTSNKIRFQGCKAVRHDDHIHIQIQ